MGDDVGDALGEGAHLGSNGVGAIFDVASFWGELGKSLDVDAAGRCIALITIVGRFEKRGGASHALGSAVRFVVSFHVGSVANRLVGWRLCRRRISVVS